MPEGFCVAPSKSNAGSLLSRMKLQGCSIPLLQGAHSADHHLGTGRNGPRWSRVAQLGVLWGCGAGGLHLPDPAALAVLERRYQTLGLIALFWYGDYDVRLPALLGFTSLQFTRGLLN